MSDVWPLLQWNYILRELNNKKDKKLFICVKGQMLVQLIADSKTVPLAGGYLSSVLAFPC